MSYDPQDTLSGTVRTRKGKVIYPHKKKTFTLKDLDRVVEAVAKNYDNEALRENPYIIRSIRRKVETTLWYGVDDLFRPRVILDGRQISDNTMVDLVEKSWKDSTGQVIGLVLNKLGVPKEIQKNVAKPFFEWYWKFLDQTFLGE